MIKNLNKYKKHITQENGELRYRGYLIRVEKDISISKPRVSNVVIDYNIKEGYEGSIIEEPGEFKETTHRWIVYFEEDKPIYYEAYAYSIEEIFDDIDDYHNWKKKKHPLENRRCY